MLFFAALAADIDACMIALSKGADDFSGLMYVLDAHMHTRKDLIRTRWIYDLRLILEYLEHLSGDGSWEVNITRCLDLFLELIGMTGDEEMCRRAGVFSWRIMRHTDGAFYGVVDKDATISGLLIGAAESGDIDLCDTIMDWYRCNPNRMLEGGAKGSSIAVCKRAIELGAVPEYSYLIMAGRYGSYEVFEFIFGRLGYRSAKTPEGTILLPDDLYFLMVSISYGPDSIKKLELLSSAHRRSNSLTYLAILHIAATIGNIELCRWCERYEQVPADIYTKVVESPFSEKAVGLVSKYCLDDKTIMSINEWAWEQTAKAIGRRPTRASTVGLAKSPSKKMVKLLSHNCAILGKYGLLRYSTLLHLAVGVRDCYQADPPAVGGRKWLLAGKIISWGKENLRPGDADYKTFDELVKSLSRAASEDSPLLSAKIAAWGEECPRSDSTEYKEFREFVETLSRLANPGPSNHH
jgi:hypothetical protein